MRKLLRLALAVGFLLAVASASASVTMVFDGAGGNSLGGVSTYPYNFHIDGVGPYPLLCDTFTAEISGGETWQANVTQFQNINAGNVNTLYFGTVNGGGAGAVQYYVAAAYLFLKAVANPSNGEWNWAVWDLFSKSAAEGSSNWASLTSGQQTDIQTDVSNALTATAGQTPSNYAGVVIYTPVDATGCGGPTGPEDGSGCKYQEFFGSTPEPSSLMLFGSGAIGLFMMLRRKSKI
ncbi:MAG: PEP-CTERM sorting domain-containing protein [Acidobacteriota bacterium]|nr:PEP-CTERM sorting domain-containing protein [Acidobacteriota bacterium]